LPRVRIEDYVDFEDDDQMIIEDDDQPKKNRHVIKPKLLSKADREWADSQKINQRRRYRDPD
jgi:hypothetical protein